jgi:hypothetical protein
MAVAAQPMKSRFRTPERAARLRSRTAHAAERPASGVEHREEGVDAFGQERLREDRACHGGVSQLLLVRASPVRVEDNMS